MPVKPALGNRPVTALGYRDAAAPRLRKGWRSGEIIPSYGVGLTVARATLGSSPKDWRARGDSAIAREAKVAGQIPPHQS